MSKEISPLNSSVPEIIKGQIYDILSETVLKKASAYIKKYETETDAILFSQGLKTIKNMLQTIENTPLDKESYKHNLIVKELILRIKEVDAIIIKLRGKRPVPIYSDSDKKTCLEIESALKSICHTQYDISFNNITPLLLEASKNKTIDNS